MAEPSLTSTNDRSGAYAARLIAEPLPAVILNCLTAEIVAANAGGLSALGLTRAIALPYALDSAMPGISAVRALANDGLETPAQRALVFWRNGRAVTLPCHITRTNVDFANAGGLATHATLIFQPALEAVQGPVTAKPAGTPALAVDTIAANDDSPPRIARDDAETLREISRRIREAQQEVSAKAAVPVDQTVADVTLSAPDSAHVQAPKSKPAPQPTPEVQPRQAPNSDTLPSLASFEPHTIAKLAHELKTPLTAIAAAAEIMRDERLGAMGNDKYLGYAADIHSSATHALAVIQDMLALPAAETGHAAAPFSAFDLTELAGGTVSSLQPLAQQRQLSLTLDAEPGLTPIQANATAVRQILLNLLTNALKFTPPGGDVRVVTGYLNDGAVFMVVRDTGEGMDEATLARAFDDGPELMTTRFGGGRGIGLKLVRKLAAENGAEFEIDSTPGKGTIVMLAFAKDLVGTTS